MVDELLDIDSHEDKSSPVIKTLEGSSSPQNNELITSRFLELIKELQKEGIDYQLTGPFSAYLKYDKDFADTFASIQIHLNEKDMERFKKICQEISLDVKDRRLSSPKIIKDGVSLGDEAVLVYYGTELFLEVFCFERLVDGTIISKDYYHDDENNPRARESIFSSKLAKEVFGRDSILYFGYLIPIVSWEYLYLMKDGNQNFLDFIETKVDQRKISNIRSLLKTDKVVQFVMVDELPESSQINSNLMENDNSKISQMLLDSTREFSETENLEFLKTKQLRKIDENYERGAITRYAVVVVFLCLLILILIGLILTKLFL